jgi:DNA polymerase V
MKAKKLNDIKQVYEFEAPVFEANPTAGKESSLGKTINSLNLNDLLAPSPERIFLVQVNGESMINESIFDGDILVVDKDDTVSDGKIVIASLNGELTVKTYREIDGFYYLVSANQKFLPIKIEEYFEFKVQGVVKHVIRKL